MTKCFTDLNAQYDPYEQPSPCDYCTDISADCRTCKKTLEQAEPYDYEPEPDVCHIYYDGR